MKALRQRNRPKAPAAHETHDSIRQQTEQFLQQGGRITQLPSGYSGIPRMQGPQQIIGKKLLL
ncbi:hypothetical protein [Amphritea balenae]|uniref:Transcriptional regulator SutA RNAP-binding domain-containing protein n=1 Tax=Amphritea balenae TaxID=452629 RepID=A0A3P1SW76_9GAMM|nr:hypothetical protein [Amphritea balenae]RRD01454.1 hypothetical protein EHS89_02520 [Amphritea balenae]GGK56989.1 hypothetical protein GCM10007941_03900 [Amphritea balenae]